MGPVKSDFYLYCPSYGHGGTYPENKAAKFKVKLPYPIDLFSYDYEVALAEITTPRHWQTTEQYSFVVFKFADRDNADKGMKEYIFDNAHAVQTEQLLEVLNKTLNDDSKASFRKSTDDYIEITAHAGYALFLPHHTATMLGFDKAMMLNGVEYMAAPNATDESNAKESTNIQEWRTKINLAIRDRARKNQVNPPNDVNFETILSGHVRVRRPPLRTQGIPNIFVYTSITDPVYFGAQQAALLRIIPYESPANNTLGGTVTTQFNKLYYLPINTSRLDEIEFFLAMDNGEPVSFVSAGKSVLLLHVRPKFQ